MKNAKTLIAFNSEDFLKIQSFVKKLKVCSTRYYLRQIQIKPIDEKIVKILATNGHIAMDMDFQVLEHRLKKPINLIFDAILAFKIQKLTVVKMIKINDERFLENEDIFCKILDIDGTFPDVEKASKNNTPEGEEVSFKFNLALLADFKTLVDGRHNVIEFCFNQNKEIAQHGVATIKNGKGEKLGVIMSCR